MTDEQIADKNSVWERMAKEQPLFTHAHDIGDNYHAVREIVLGGSVTWAATNGYFQPCEGKRVMDVGANLGIYSAYCGIHGADVVAYEASPTVAQLLEGMTVATGLEDRVKVVNKAVWIYNGIVPYLGHRTPNEDVTCYNGGVKSNGVNWTPDDFAKAPRVECIPFGDAIGKVEWDCVKMDIEGAEFEVILAAPHEALRRVKFMYVEFHSWAARTLYEQTMNKLHELFVVKTFKGRDDMEMAEAAFLWRKK